MRINAKVRLVGVIGASLIGWLALDDAMAQKVALRDRFRWPLRGKVIEKFNQNGNDGVDIAAPIGEAVHAVGDGVVSYAGDEIKTYGKLVLVRHVDGYVSAYAGNSELLVAQGDTVKRGQIIAKSGRLGDAGAPRLHFELRANGKPIDPTKHLVAQ